MITRLLATLEISRPHNMVAAGGCVYAGYHLSGGREIGLVLWPVIITAFVAGLGNLINDVFDADIDAANKPNRPIPSGRLTPKYVAWMYGSGTSIVTALGAFVLSYPVFSLMVAWELLLFVYAARAKRIALFGNILIATVCSSAFIVGAMITGVYEIVLFPFGFAFFFVMGRELVKGAEDVEGDRPGGAETLAVRFGAARTAGWGAMLLSLCAVAAPIPSLTGYFGRLYGVLIQTLLVPGVLSAAYVVLESPRKAVFRRASWMLKVEMLIGIIVMGLGRL